MGRVVSMPERVRAQPARVRVLPGACALALSVLLHGAEPSVASKPWGTMDDGTPVELFTVANGRGIEASVMTLGATLTTVTAPDRDGKPDVITAHRKTLDEYKSGHPLLGSIAGRFANRIAGARFTIDGVEYPLAANSGKHHIHGGGRDAAFHWQVWKGEPLRDGTTVGVKLSLVSPDGKGGFPGELRVEVEYRLTADDELTIEYRARTTKPTHVNLTNHAYWNLAGAGSGATHDHRVELFADEYLPSDATGMPTGEIRAVAGTAMAFAEATAIGARLDALEQRKYDHCYVLRKADGERLALAARVHDPKSGRILEVLTTQPGVQFYNGNPEGFCLETQHFPNSPNEPRFPSTLLCPGETLRETTIHRFRTDRAPASK